MNEEQEFAGVTASEVEEARRVLLALALSYPSYDEPDALILRAAMNIATQRFVYVMKLEVGA